MPEYETNRHTAALGETGCRVPLNWCACAPVMHCANVGDTRTENLSSKHQMPWEEESERPGFESWLIPCGSLREEMNPKSCEGRALPVLSTPRAPPLVRIHHRLGWDSG